MTEEKTVVISAARYEELVKAELGCMMLCDIIERDDTYAKMEHLKAVRDTICTTGNVWG